MSGTDTTDAGDGELVFESDLDAPPEKVWRAVTTPELREHWLPSGALTDPEPVAAMPGEEVSYRMRDNEPPFLESTVVRPRVRVPHVRWSPPTRNGDGAPADRIALWAELAIAIPGV